MRMPDGRTDPWMSPRYDSWEMGWLPEGGRRPGLPVELLVRCGTRPKVRGRPEYAPPLSLRGSNRTELRSVGALREDRPSARPLPVGMLIASAATCRLAATLASG
jgi:hypothetical protein